MHLEARHPGEGSLGRADLGRKVRERRDVVAAECGGVGELGAGELHAVAGIAGKAHDHGVELFDRLRGRLEGAVVHRIPKSCRRGNRIDAEAADYIPILPAKCMISLDSAVNRSGIHGTGPHSARRPRIDEWVRPSARGAGEATASAGLWGRVKRPRGPSVRHRDGRSRILGSGQCHFGGADRPEVCDDMAARADGARLAADPGSDDVAGA